MGDRTYDVVLFGATGFTGGLTAEHLARVAGANGARWAIAGRSREKLDGVIGRLQESGLETGGAGIIEADSSDPASLVAMARQARVVITTVGPYIRYGEPLVRACIEGGADYIDLTGEPEFVEQMIDRYDDAARAAGVRIVNCGGFESVPHDAGVLFTVRKLQEQLGPGEALTTPIRIDAFLRARGSFSGGTFHSALIAMSRTRELSKLRKARAHKRASGAGAGPAETVAQQPRRVKGISGRVHYERELRAWACPMPTIDPQVVLRTARAFAEYGPDFRFGLYMLIPHLPTVIGGAVALSGVYAMAQLKPTRSLLMKLVPAGHGPSEAQRRRSFFQLTLRGEAGAHRVTCQVRGGDPGYGETARMLAESALCMALDQDRSPGYKGVITPVMAMGDALITRLQAIDVAVEVIG